MTPKQTVVALLGLALVAFNLFVRPRSGGPSRAQVLTTAYLPTANNPSAGIGPVYNQTQGAPGQPVGSFA